MNRDGKKSTSNLQAGFGLLELMVAVFILSVAMTGVVVLNLQLMKRAVHAADLIALDNFKRNLVPIFNDNAAWTRMLTINGVPWTTPNLIRVVDGAGNTVYDARDGRNGITTNGILCGPHGRSAPYNQAAFNYPSRNCPLRYDIRWVAVDGSPQSVVAIFAELKAGVISGQRQTELVFNNYLYSYMLDPGITWNPGAIPLPNGVLYRRR